MRHREDGRPCRDREWQQQLIGEVPLDGGARNMMLPQPCNRFVGNRFRRLPQSTKGGKARRERLVFGQEKYACTRAGGADPLWLDIDWYAQIAQSRARPVRHALRNMGRQVCGESTAADPPQRPARERLEGCGKKVPLSGGVGPLTTLHTTSPPPRGYQPECFSLALMRKPIRLKTGR
jgi:hypothetical protein